MDRFYQTVKEIREQNDLIKFRIMYEKQKKKLVIFGAGDCGHHIYEMLHQEGIEVSCFCDNRPKGKTDEATGLEIMQPEDLDGSMEDLAVLICVVDIQTEVFIHRQLLSLGLKEEQILNMREYFFRASLPYLEENINKYKKAYELLEEEYSRKVYLARMKRIFILEDLSGIESPHEKEYFDDMIHLTDNEVFIDCGGFDGDTSVKFLEMCQNKYKDIVIFEPELCKRTDIEKNMSGQRYQLYQTGVWSKAARLCFFAMGTDSSFVTEKESEYMVDVVSLDETVYNMKPTFIKMDIEGSEQEALKGSKNILKDFKPKLAICIYHKPDDLFQIPLLIKEMNPSYHLYVRHYSNSRTGTVLYAL